MSNGYTSIKNQSGIVTATDYDADAPLFKACRGVKSFLGGFCLSSKKWEGMNDNDKFYFSNKWGAALMLVAGAVTADPFTLVAATGALGSNAAFDKLKRSYASAAMGKETNLDANSEELINDKAENRANIHINALKIVCHLSQAIGCEFFLEDTSFDASGTPIDPSLEDVKSNLGAAAGAAYIFDAGYTAYKQKMLDTQADGKSELQQSGISGMFNKISRYGLGSVTGAVLTARGVATTACGAAVAVASGGIAPVLVTACGAAYLAGGVYKMVHEYKKTKEMDEKLAVHTEDETEDEHFSSGHAAVLPVPA